ncbi:MAG: hypothetical protein ACK4XK_08120, partial [Casimicrobiaceae bacterium]
ICRLLGLQPKERPAFVPDLESLLKQYQLHAEDKRPKGGAMWVYADDFNATFNRKIRALGFNYRTNRGWFRE